MKEERNEEHPAVAASRRSWDAVHRKSKADWLALFTEDAVVEDPVGRTPLDPAGPGWATCITRVEPNIIEIAGYPLQEIIGRKGLPDVAHLLLHGEFPDPRRSDELARIVGDAFRKPIPSLRQGTEDRVAVKVIRFLLADEALISEPFLGDVERTLFCIGRVVRFLASLLQTEDALEAGTPGEPFSGMLYRLCTGRPQVDESIAGMLEALVVAAVDHGVTSPSAQAAILAASVRAPFETAVAMGLGTITRVHGGAGLEAAELMRQAVRQAGESGAGFSRSLRELLEARVRTGEKVPGLGHRVHEEDPRCTALLALAEETGAAADCVSCSRMIPALFTECAGVSLPMNVDGAIGAVIADLDLPLELAEGFFLLGRIAGLSAHYAEELSGFPEMRRIFFSEARYEGPSTRHLGGA